MKRLSFLSSLIILFLICLAFLFTFYSDVLKNPNQYLFSPDGDGISSYYNSLYHIYYDSSYVNFEGMNYPYGEHLTYSVNNPLFTNSIKFLGNFFPSVKEYTIGIFNSSMLLSFFLTSLFLFLLFYELKVNHWLSIAMSVSIMALSPQIFRMLGHLSLSYSFFIPLTIWLLYKSHIMSNKKLWVILQFLNISFWILVHPYLAIIAASFVVLFAIVAYFTDYKSEKRKLFYYATLIVVTLLPIFMFKVFVSSTDIHQCRTTNPYGVMVYTAGAESVFIPHHPPVKPWLNQLIIINQEWEGWVYIGLIADIVFFALIFLLIKGWKAEKRGLFYKQVFGNRFLNILLIASVILVLFSMGIPFKLFPGYVPDIFRFIKEFRALGRFAWIFYFVFSIFVVYYIDKLLHLKTWFSRKYQKIGFILLLFAIYLFESVYYHIEVSREIVKTPNYFISENDLAITESLQNIQPPDYQAILPLPFYHRGSENFSKSPTNKMLKYSELLSFKTGLPLMSSYLARTSIDESKKLIQIINPVALDKPVKHDISSRKPFLILYSNEDLVDTEAQLFTKSTLLVKNDEFGLYKIEFDSLFQRYDSNLNDERKKIVNLDFDNCASSVSYKGGGAFTGNLKEMTLLAVIPIDSILLHCDYEIGFWMYNCGDNCGQDKLNAMVFLEQKDNDEKIEWLQITNPSNSYVIDGCWSYVRLRFSGQELSPDLKSLKVFMKGPDYSTLNFVVDELNFSQIE